jgi:hypothetical protein
MTKLNDSNSILLPDGARLYPKRKPEEEERNARIIAANKPKLRRFSEDVEIKRIGSYRDGGTIVVKLHNGRMLYVDDRINSPTRGELVSEYPKPGLTLVPLPDRGEAIRNYFRAVLAARNAYKAVRAAQRSEFVTSSDYAAYDAHRNEDLF